MAGRLSFACTEAHHAHAQSHKDGVSVSREAGRTAGPADMVTCGAPEAVVMQESEFEVLGAFEEVK